MVPPQLTRLGAAAVFLAAAAPVWAQPRPAIPDPKTIRAGWKSHDRALYIKSGWIRDPYIVLGPDGYYYLTGTTEQPGRDRAATDPWNSGLGPGSIVGWKVQVWRSKDLVNWQHRGAPFSLRDGVWASLRPDEFARIDESQWRLWAPELHHLDGRWAIIHTSPSPVRSSNLAFTKGHKLEGPFTQPMGERIGHRHDPSLFRDEDGTVWMVWGATFLAPLQSDFSGFAADPVRVEPSNRRIGHEGSLIRRIGGKYVLFGTGWSTDKTRKGTYNLYYCVADKITGPYGERQFAGRFLGHGTPFQDKQGRWWSTAFYNGNLPPLDRGKLAGSDLSDTAYSINPQGVTIVPLEITVEPGGNVRIRAKDSAYASPGLEEVQKFPSAPSR